MNIDVPVLNQEDGSLRFTQTIDAKQAQTLLSFALNFLTATGLAAAYGVAPPDDDGQQDLPFND